MLFASGASAFFHPSPNGRCHVTMHVPARIVAGESATVFGQLICRRHLGTEGKAVRLFRHVPGVPGFVLAQTTTTGAGGAYQFQLTGSVVENDGVWHVIARGAESADRRIRVAPQVTFEGPPEGTQILTGVPNKVTFTGKVTPADIGARVILQRQNALTGNEWHAIDMGVVEAGGGYTITHTFLVPGDANLRVLVRSQGRNIPEASSPLSYEISQTQNSALTITANADPVVYGQSVTIGGTLEGVSTSQTVTLLARTAHQHGFAQVTQVSTSSTGAYTFPAQTPTNSTYYKVQSDGKFSAVLFEGVKYALTAEASPTSLMEGQLVTFSGKVAPTPLRPGHVIYLERQNASSAGFHVVRVGSVTPEATFSIPYQVFGVGSEVFRVYIPGGPDNGGTASQTFTIDVSPAPAVALKEAPNNSSTPAEGSVTAEAEKEGEERGETEAGERPHGHHHR
ncbi:MAG TPA: hypothetical protein VNV42_09445 [Solirubrobacteraceae bacterium]|nr:hypothetical protein [Solirubrobacteraceae bacterium]